MKQDVAVTLTAPMEKFAPTSNVSSTHLLAKLIKSVSSAKSVSPEHVQRAVTQSTTAPVDKAAPTVNALQSSAHVTQSVAPVKSVRAASVSLDAVETKIAEQVTSAKVTSVKKVDVPLMQSVALVTTVKQAVLAKLDA